MDYRHFRGEPLIKIPAKVRRQLHKLRYAGIVCFIVSVGIPLLILTHAIRSTYLLNLLDWIALALAPTLYLVGMSFDNAIDRAR